jgi:hypothetical protein
MTQARRIAAVALALPVLGLAAAPALAGGLTEPAPEPVVTAPPPPVETGNDWTGLYGGASIGYGNLDAGGTDGSGALYGLRAGYDYDFGSWVLGGGLDYDWSDVDLEGGAGSLDAVARLKVRAGADLGNTLVYAAGGLARADANIGGTDFSDDGFFGNWTVGGEVLLHRFDDFDGTGTDIDATTANVNVGLRF